MSLSSDLIPGLKEPVPVQTLSGSSDPLSMVRLEVLRLDLMHPLVSGNKWYKLKYNLADCLKRGSRIVISFGGAWSNHLHALAAACQISGIACIGVVRGHKPETLSPSLCDMQAMGMQLHFVNRETYRLRHDPAFHATLIRGLGCDEVTTQIIPEGGSNDLAMRGCAEILSCHSIEPDDYDLIVTACGTGATLAGLILGAAGKGRFLGVSVLKGGDFLRRDIRKRLIGVDCACDNWQLRTEFHCGGYARQTDELLSFIESFTHETDLPLDRVYTGKLFFALKQLVASGYIVADSRILAIHTGGLQGNRLLLNG